MMEQHAENYTKDLNMKLEALLRENGLMRVRLSQYRDIWTASSKLESSLVDILFTLRSHRYQVQVEAIDILIKSLRILSKSRLSDHDYDPCHGKSKSENHSDTA